MTETITPHVKRLMLPPDATGTKTHEWFRNSHGGAYWLCERPMLLGNKSEMSSTVSYDEKLCDMFSAHAISAMWGCSSHVDDYKLHSLAWFYAATNTPEYVALPVVGFEVTK